MLYLKRPFKVRRWREKRVNERLRNAMIAAHIDIDTITRSTNVDPKTVQRWLKGRVPHARHRWKVAKLLDVSEYDIWPSETIPTNNTSEIVLSYAHRCDAPPSVWWQLFAQANRQIDMLANAMLFIPEQHAGLAELLKEKAAHGCKIRIALADPECEAVRLRDDEEGLGGTLPGRIRNCLYHYRTLRQINGIEIHYHSTILYNSLFRGDEEMLVTPHMYGLHGYKAPLLHLRDLGLGVFTNFAQHFEAVWATTKPIPE